LRGSKHQEFDLIITDMMMPTIDGVGIIQRFLRRNDKISIIAMSGAAQPHEYGPLDVAIRWVARFVLPKPFRRADLLALVRECLGPATVTRAHNTAKS
jgi:CheY-like chemotaxis protein